MKQYLIYLLLLLPIVSYSQEQYGAGVFYTQGTPTIVVDTSLEGSRLAYDIINNVFYTHSGNSWIPSSTGTASTTYVDSLVNTVETLANTTVGFTMQPNDFTLTQNLPNGATVSYRYGTSGEIGVRYEGSGGKINYRNYFDNLGDVFGSHFRVLETTDTDNASLIHKTTEIAQLGRLIYRTSTNLHGDGAEIAIGEENDINSILDDISLMATGEIYRQISEFNKLYFPKVMPSATPSLWSSGSNGTFNFLRLGSGLSIAGDTLIATGGGGGATNLSYTASPTNGTVSNDTGTDATLTLADGTNAGLMAPADFTKLSVLGTTKLHTYAPSTTTLTIDIQNAEKSIERIDLASSGSPLTLTVNNAFGSGTEVGFYTFHFINGTDVDVVLPASFLNINDGTTVGTITISNGQRTAYYDGTNFWMEL